MSNVRVPAIDENYVSVTTVRVVAIDANYDSVTTPPFEYRQAHVYPLFKNGKFRLQQFSGIQAIREAVRSEADTPIEFLTGSGHGRSSVFSGFETFTIYGLRIDRMDEPKGRIVHFLACETAEELGPDAIGRRQHLHGVRERGRAAPRDDELPRLFVARRGRPARRLEQAEQGVVGDRGRRERSRAVAAGEQRVQSRAAGVSAHGLETRLVRLACRDMSMVE